MIQLSHTSVLRRHSFLGPRSNHRVFTNCTVELSVIVHNCMIRRRLIERIPNAAHRRSEIGGPTFDQPLIGHTSYGLRTQYWIQFFREVRHQLSLCLPSPDLSVHGTVKTRRLFNSIFVLVLVSHFWSLWKDWILSCGHRGSMTCRLLDFCCYQSGYCSRNDDVSFASNGEQCTRKDPTDEGRFHSSSSHLNCTAPSQISTKNW